MGRVNKKMEVKYMTDNNVSFQEAPLIKSQPKVLIMMPTFNRPEYFQLALESAINQSYQNLEIVVTDDSTNDLTANLIQKYLHDPRIKYHKHENFRHSIRMCGELTLLIPYSY